MSCLQSAVSLIELSCLSAILQKIKVDVLSELLDVLSVWEFLSSVINLSTV